MKTIESEAQRILTTLSFSRTRPGETIHAVYNHSRYICLGKTIPNSNQELLVDFLASLVESHARIDRSFLDVAKEPWGGTTERVSRSEAKAEINRLIRTKKLELP